jgi:hypothetical protein
VAWCGHQRSSRTEFPFDQHPWVEAAPDYAESCLRNKPKRQGAEILLGIVRNSA